MQNLKEKLIEGKGAFIFVGVVGLEKRFVKVNHRLYLLVKKGMVEMMRIFAKELTGSVRFNMLSPGHLKNSINRNDRSLKLFVRNEKRLWL